MRLLLIRHAQSTDNVPGILGTTIPGPELTELGREQAAAIPKALAGQPIDAIYVSPMQRTGLTAAPLAAERDLSIEVLEGLEEIDAGDFEGRSDQDAIHVYMGTIISWWQNIDARVPGGESGTEFFQRFTDAIEAATAEHDVVAVFSHGASIRTWASSIPRNVGQEFSKTHDLPNTAMVVLEGSSADGWIVTHWDGEPIGGAELEDELAADPTGESPTAGIASN
jgi:probable phosphoglycerate mutase